MDVFETFSHLEITIRNDGDKNRRIGLIAPFRELLKRATLDNHVDSMALRSRPLISITDIIEPGSLVKSVFAEVRPGRTVEGASRRARLVSEILSAPVSFAAGDMILTVDATDPNSVKRVIDANTQPMPTAPGAVTERSASPRPA